MRVRLIDHYDSFTFNVIGWLEGDPDVEVERLAFDDDRAMERAQAEPLPLILSPGPKRPDDAPQTLVLAQKLLGAVPILGICLGHQQLARLAGATVKAALAPFHGSTRLVHPAAATGLFEGFTGPFQAATYNSLVVEEGTLPAPWRVTARCELGEVQGLERVVPGEAPALGIQFHPESFLSEYGALLRANFLRMAKII